MTILLAYRCHDLGRMEFYSRFTPLGLGSINALLRREGHHATLLNCSAWSWRKVGAFLRRARPDVFGVSVFTFNRHEAMRRAGCTHIQYGVESGSPRMLQRLNKGISIEQTRAAAASTRAVGLGLSIYLITGIESATDEDLASTLRLIEEIRPHDGLVSPMTVYPGTALYEEAKGKRLLSDDDWTRSRAEAYFVRDDPWTRRSVRTVLAALRRVGRAAAYGPDDFARQRDLVGDCYALRLTIGEFFERRRNLARAAEEYGAILRANPASLWARMRLGRLALRRRRTAGSHRSAAATRFVSRPIPSIETVTSSPAASGPTPSGVPVAMTSPGNRVMICEMKPTSSATPKIILETGADCLRTPLTRVSTTRSSGRRPVAMQGPRGQKVSNDLARVNCTSLRCRSRAVTSLTQV
jgi:hypothetical protein